MSQIMKATGLPSEIWSWIAAFAPTALALTGAYRKSRDKSAAGPTERRITVPAKPLAAAMHWSRVAAVVEGATLAAEAMRELQTSARTQIDLAEYALDNLLAEITPVMKLVPVRTERRPSTRAPLRSQALAA